MYLKYIEGKSVVAEGFIRTLLKSKIYKKMTGNNCKSYLDYLNKLVDEYNNPYHCSIGKKPFHVNYSAMSEEFESIRLWSLFCPIRVYASLHFLLIHLENCFLSLCAFCLFCLLHVEFDVIFINFIAFAQSLFGHVICVFVLTYEKQFVNVIKI